MKKAYVIAVLLSQLVLLGCSGPKEIALVTHKEVSVDPKLLEPCKPLVTLDRANPDKFAALFDSMAQNAILYKECSLKQEGSIIFIRRMTNKE